MDIKNGLIPYRIGEKWGYSDFNQNIVLSCIYDRAKPFFEERAVVSIDSKWGVINKQGDFISACQYDDISDFKNGFSSVCKNGKWGFIDINGFEKIPLIYDNVLSFSDERAAVKIDNKIAFIDTEANLITEFKYDNCSDFLRGIASVERSGKNGCIDLKGNEIIPCIYDIPIDFSEGLAAVSIIENNGELNPTAKKFNDYEPGVLQGYREHGNMIWKDSAGNIFDRESIDLASKNHKCGYINLQNEIVIPLKYDMAFNFKEGLACVCNNNKFGFIDSSGNLIIEYKYDDGGDFNEGLAKVMINGKWGYINKQGVIVVDCIYNEVHDFRNGIAKVINDNNDELFINYKGGKIDLGGVEIDDQYEEINYFEHKDFSEDLIAASFNWSDIFYIDKKGKCITDRKYIDASPFKNGLAYVRFKVNQNIKSGFIDFEGKEYWEEDVFIEKRENTVLIGEQEWSLYNLDVDCFRNGESIPQAQSDEEWQRYADAGKPAWCYFYDKYNQNRAYGKLYNWFAATDSREIAPIGFHIPSVEEIQNLLRKIGPGRLGLKLKSDELWDGTNESGFNALPSGIKCGPPTIEYWEFQGSKEEEYAGFWLKCKDERPYDGVALILSDNNNFPPSIQWESKYNGLSIRLLRE